MIPQDILQLIYKYCREIEYGEVTLRFKIHRGTVAEAEEVGPPLKRYRFKEDREETKE